MHMLCGHNAKQGKTWGHVEKIPSDYIKTVSKREFISQETESVHCSFIVDTLEHDF